jgi:hypothetical protein
VTIELPNNDIARAASKGVDRRTLLKAGAWAAPVLVLTTAAPAMAASIEPVPAAQLTVTSGALINVGLSGALGPLSWAGGTIAWSRLTGGDPTTASVGYTVTIAGPGLPTTTLITSSTNIVNGGSFTVPGLSYGAAGLAAGAYSITLTAIGSDGSTSASSSVTLVVPAAVVASATVVGAAGNKHNVTLSLTGPANTVVSIATTLTAVSAAPAFPTSATIGANGTYSFTSSVNATGQTAGSVRFVLSGTNVVAVPADFTKTIPVKSVVGVVTL